MEHRKNMASSLVCEVCGKNCETTTWITKQIGGTFHKLYVCEDCENDHNNYLENLTENFRRQFGEK